MDRYDPFESMDRMFEQMRRSMLDAQHRPMLDAQRRPMVLPDGSTEIAVDGEADFGLGTRNVRLERTDEGFVAMADLPGFETDEITVSFDDGTLFVEAAHETAEDDETSIRRATRRFSESFSVPGVVDVDAISGSYRNGVLEIELPTTETDDDAHVIDLE